MWLQRNILQSTFSQMFWWPGWHIFKNWLLWPQSPFVLTFPTQFSFSESCSSLALFGLFIMIFFMLALLLHSMVLWWWLQNLLQHCLFSEVPVSVQYIPFLLSLIPWSAINSFNYNWNYRRAKNHSDLLLDRTTEGLPVPFWFMISPGTFVIFLVTHLCLLV